MNSEAFLLRARRRYRALLRESAALVERGLKDDEVERELRKLEEEYPSLVENKTVKREVIDSCSDVKSDENADPVVTQNPVSTFCVTSQKSRYRDENRYSLNTSEEKKNSYLSSDSPKLNREPMNFLAFLSNCFLLWNGAQLPLFLGVKSCILIAFFSSISTVLHCELLDPLSPMGKVISPISLLCLVHLGKVILLRRKGPVLPSIIVLYLILDVIPSVVMSLVVSVITAILVDLVKNVV